MIEAVRGRGSAHAGTWESEEAIFVALTLPWESEVSGWAGPRVFDHGRFVVAGDASLYERQLPSVPPGRVDSAALIARRLDEHGTAFSERIDGDFALAIWDQVEKTLILSRDHWGQRQLAYARLGSGGVVFASTPAAVVEHPDVSRTIDVDYLAAAAAHLVPPPDRCAYGKVRMVPPGHSIGLSPTGEVRFRHVRSLPAFVPSSPFTSTVEAARSLRSLLVDAIDRRLADDGPTSIWLSGGWDSPAVFAAGRVALDTDGRSSRDLVPVSLSYPEGDSGREDEFINAIASFWNVGITWVHADEVSLLDGASERAVRRDDPFAHPFEAAQRALARASRASGCRVVLDGNGGDQLFSGGDVDLADLLQDGNWAPLLKRYRRTRSKRLFARNCILPLLSRGVREWISLLRGRPLRGYWDTVVPEWMVPRESLSRAALAHVDPEPGESASAYEARYLITHPHLARVVSWAYAIGLEEGVELRSPLLDSRVLGFVARRPAAERYDGVTSKTLLRESVRGLLPEEVLAPRRLKTGTPVDYVKREYRPRLGGLLTGTLGQRHVHLVDLGVVSRTGLQQAISVYDRERDYQLGHRLVSTLQAEWWVAAHSGGP
jgi:asparagine synthase (glutamine-hydrolysing)